MKFQGTDEFIGVDEIPGSDEIIWVWWNCKGLMNLQGSDEIPIVSASLESRTECWYNAVEIATKSLNVLFLRLSDLIHKKDVIYLDM